MLTATLASKPDVNYVVERFFIPLVLPRNFGLNHHVQMIRAPALACLAAIDFALRQSRQLVPKTVRDKRVAGPA
ncbi:hypothetical protein [Mycobacterium sp. 852002-10029_SCH5224772]|uniref:hypothetical protein n=1 Tax=Mycobacterium sp. 852002-10029_SCH5224772 TaxID=1834083 RepID=UPI000A8999F7|nr:hypothetical protein [Mycobacterium sp. 852002-10029_SCH5224772]